ncbi:cytochrome b561 [Paracoccus halophilus]|uniref:Cytochrome b561 n=1 Tax=Paracoccus halophilus TaxID=376733 RepID=A0A099F5U0_9RHOB|nr:cytochrome b [Paracoccus halophilus]KGJ05638.1 cytochrome B561 [Paracoccus halophilus]SFA47574.1 cytochrome b561 [Paracoccus halophilus]
MRTTRSGKALPFRDTTAVYGRVSRLLHWTIAALLLWQLLGMGLKLMLGRTPVSAFFVGSHQQVGTVLFGLIVLRVIWALANSGNRPAHGGGLRGLAVRLGHLALYAVMVLVPFSALLRAYGSDKPFAPFGVEIFAAQQPAIGWMVQAGNLIHGEGGWLLLALIAGHVAMVAVHEGLWRDGTLSRMAGRQGARL